MLLRIRLERRTEALHIRKAQLLHDRQHLRLVPLHLVQADLVDLRRRLVQRRALPHPKRVVRVAIRHRPHARVLPARRDVLRPQKLREPLIRRQHLRRIASSISSRDPLLLRRTHRLRKLLQRQRKRAVRRLLLGNLLRLHQHLLHQVLRRHPPFVHAQLMFVIDLRERTRHLSEPRNVVVVVLHRLKLQLRRQLRQSRYGSR